MKKFLIVARSFSDLHEKYINIIRDYISSHGGMCILDLDTCPDSSENQVTVEDDIECIITVGGDGTVVRVAQNVTNRKVPIVGLNCGHLGYLCDMTVDNVEHCLNQLLSDNYKIDERMMLEGDLSSDENNHFKALNDIVVASDAAGLYVLNITVKVNGITGLAINHLDTIGKLPRFKLCVAYDYNGERITNYSTNAKFQETCKPIYEEFEGNFEIGGATTFEELPEKAKVYLKRIEELTGVPIKFIGTGAGREELIVR